MVHVDPTRDPIENIPDLLCLEPWLDKQRTPVSELHLLDSQALPCSRACAVFDASPKPEPCSVSENEPLTTTLVPRTELSAPNTIETGTDKVPVRTPTENDDRKLEATPLAAKHTTELSDSQALASHKL